MNHTKGKWSITGSGNSNFKLCVIAEDGGSVCHITNWQEAKANAKLISKSPELLEALKRQFNGNIVVIQYSRDAKLIENAIKLNEEIESLINELES